MNGSLSAALLALILAAPALAAPEIVSNERPRLSAAPSVSAGAAAPSIGGVPALGPGIDAAAPTQSGQAAPAAAADGPTSVEAKAAEASAVESAGDPHASWLADGAAAQAAAAADAAGKNGRNPAARLDRIFDHGALEGKPLSIERDQTMATPRYNKPGFEAMHCRHLVVRSPDKKALAAFRQRQDAIVTNARGSKDLLAIHSFAHLWRGSIMTTAYGTKAGVERLGNALRDEVSAVNTRAAAIRNNAVGAVAAAAVGVAVSPLVGLLAGAVVTPALAVSAAVATAVAFFWYRKYARERSGASKRAEPLWIIQDMLVLPGIALMSAGAGAYAFFVLTSPLALSITLVVSPLAFYGGFTGAMSWVPHVDGDYRRPMFLFMLASMAAASIAAMALGDWLDGALGLAAIGFVHIGVDAAKKLVMTRYGAGEPTKPETRFRQGVLGLNIALPLLALALAWSQPAMASFAAVGVFVSFFWTAVGAVTGIRSVPAAQDAWKRRLAERSKPS